MIFCPRVQRQMVLGNFHCRGVPLIWFIVVLGSALLAVSAGRVCLDHFLLFFHSLLLIFSLGDDLV